MKGIQVDGGEMNALSENHTFIFLTLIFFSQYLPQLQHYN